MTKIKLEHIDNLRKGKKSGIKIGSRGVPHHLHKYEQFKYESALRNRYLEITTRDRVNLKNLWFKVCSMKGWNNYTLEKDSTGGTAKIYLNDKEVSSGSMDEMKLTIKNYV